MKSLILPLTSIGAGMVLENARTPAAGNGDPFGDDIASMIEGMKWLWPIEFAANTPEAIRWISFGGEARMVSPVRHLAAGEARQ
jgi:hypothetical protein